MKIHNIEVADRGTHQQITAAIGNLTLWFRVPAGIGVNCEDATPFVLLSLVPAMLFGENIEVDEKYGVSPRILGAVEQIFRIYRTWNPVFRQIDILARPAVKSVEKSRACCLFSSGVDGTYTFLQSRDSLDSLVFMNGFEGNHSTAKWSAMVEKNQRFANRMGSELLPVETNHRSFLAAFGLSGFANFAFRLAAIGQLLEFTTVYISGADTYRVLFPSGCHPLLDPLMSTEATRILHTGLEADRADKIGLIKQCPEVLENLNFCFYGGVTNCGRCSKCVRTYIAFLLNGIDDFPFEQQPTLADLAKVRISSHEQAEFFESFLSTAVARNMTELARIMRRRLVRFKLKQLLVQAEATYFPLLTTLRKLRLPPDDHLVSVEIFPRYSDQSAVDYYRERLRSESFQQEVHDIGTVFR